VGERNTSLIPYNSSIKQRRPGETKEKKDTQKRTPREAGREDNTQSSEGLSQLKLRGQKGRREGDDDKGDDERVRDSEREEPTKPLPLANEKGGWKIDWGIESLQTKGGEKGLDHTTFWS